MEIKNNFENWLLILLLITINITTDLSLYKYETASRDNSK